jgi:hypothetical protein
MCYYLFLPLFYFCFSNCLSKLKKNGFDKEIGTLLCQGYGGGAHLRHPLLVNHTSLDKVYVAGMQFLLLYLRLHERDYIHSM